MRIFLPTILLALVAIGWSVFWLVAADRAGSELDRAIARLAAASRQVTCGERKIGGYPFRLEVRCRQLGLTLDTRDGPLVAEAADFVAVAQLPVPSHLIFELKGPVTLGRDPGAPVLTLNFASAQASVHGDPRSLDAVSLRLVTPVLERNDLGAAQVGLRADSLELHARRSPAGPTGTWDTVAKLVNGQAPALESPLAHIPTSVELQASLSEADTLERGPTPEALRAFAQAGGKLHVALLRVEQGDVVAEAKGDLGLDVQGRINGESTVAVANLQQFLKKASEAGLGWLWALVPLGKAGKLGDRPAATYAVRVVEGRISVGPLPFGSLLPLF